MNTISSHDAKLRQTGRFFRRAVTAFCVIVVIVVLWGSGVSVFEVPEYLVPSPKAVGQAFVRHHRSLTIDLAWTALESVVGFVIASLVSILIAVVLAQGSKVYHAIMPSLIALKAVPIIAVAPLIVLVFGNDFTGKVTMVALICFFPIVVNLAIGLRDTPREQLDLLRTLLASRLQVLMLARVPNALSHFFAGLRVASTLSVVGAIVAEFAGANRGIGFAILLSALRLDAPLLYASIILASALGLVMYYVIELVESRIVFWRPFGAGGG